MGSFYLIINVLTFFIWGFDKSRAKLNQWRVPEIVLLTLIIIGGGIGALVGIGIFSHKSRKTQIKIIALVSIAIHLFLFFYVFR